MEVKAVLRRYRVAPRKVRLVVNLVRGLDIDKALGQLDVLDKKSTLAISKLLNSAVANAVNNFSLEKNNLYIKSVFVDQGPVFKRWMPKAHGRATKIKKYTSHITIILDERVEKLKKENTKKVDVKTKKYEKKVNLKKSTKDKKNSLNNIPKKKFLVDRKSVKNVNATRSLKSHNIIKSGDK